MLVSHLKDIMAKGNNAERLNCIKLVLRLMELDQPEAKVEAMIGAAIIAPAVNPLPRPIEGKVLDAH
jgi:hypothetical protein